MLVTRGSKLTIKYAVECCQIKILLYFLINTKHLNDIIMHKNAVQHVLPYVGMKNTIQLMSSLIPFNFFSRSHEFSLK